MNFNLSILKAVTLGFTLGLSGIVSAQEKSLTISAEEEWQSTGVTISERGKLFVTAHGTWMNSVSADGAAVTPSITDACRTEYQAFPESSLIGKVGVNGSAFFVGSSRMLQLPSSSGELFLRIADDCIADNMGNLSVTLSESEPLSSLGVSNRKNNVGSVQENLDIFAPSLDYQSHLGIQNIWASLKYSGLNNQRLHTWTLKDYNINPTIRIPVVVHVLYQDGYGHESNISEAQIKSQIDVLNRDYRKSNDDLHKVPEEFRSRIADMEIEFEMATLDPKGSETNGITRTLDLTHERTDGDLHFSNRGGKDAWPSDQYLNIWVHDGADRHGNIRVGGEGQFPGGDPLTDGIIIAYKAFGTVGTLARDQELHLGRTVTHEVGHWLNLRHIDGNFSCDTDDGVEDTPVTSRVFTKHPVHPSFSCGSSDMFMNFMTPFVADNEIIMFTEGQKARAHAVFSPGGGRENLYNHLTQ